MISPFRRPLANSRLLTLLAALCGLFVLILIRLYFLQIVHGSFFTHLADRHFTTTVTLPSTRGTITDRHGRPLAITRQRLSAFIDRNIVSNEATATQFLKQYFPLVHQEWVRNPEQNFFWLTRHISEERKAEIHALSPDAHFMYEPSRWYVPDYAPELTGFANIDSQGISGIERTADQQLAGTPTTIRYQQEPDESGLYFVHNVITPGANGQNVQLSVDQELQFLIRRELSDTVKKTGARRACAIVMDPVSGEILTLVQAPSYNPNNPAEVAPEHRRNHSISSCHELGSTMHVFSGLAAFAEGITTPDELINGEGKVAYIDGVKIENKKTSGTIPFWQVIAHASNVGIAKVCRRLGPLLFEHLHRLGFTTATHIELPGERSGFVPPPERWNTATPLRLSYGYESMCSLLQLGRAFSIIANNGATVRPTILRDKRPGRGLQLYDSEPIRQIRDVLVRGANAHHLTLPGFTVLGHLGSAVIIKNSGESTQGTILSGGCIIEKDGYQRVIVSLIEAPHITAEDEYEVSAHLMSRLATITSLHECR